MSIRGFACPVFEGKLVSKTIFVPLGLAGAIVWSFALFTASIGLKRSIGLLLVIAAPLALFVSLWVDNPLPLIIATFALLACWLSIHPSYLTTALLVGICVIESLVITYLMFRAIGLPTPLSAALPFHFSLYCFVAPILPPIVMLSFFSLFLLPLLRGMPQKSSSLRFESKATTLFSLLVSFMLWLVLYSPSLNPGPRLVGVDSRIRYYPHAMILLEEGPSAVLRIGYDRPLSYTILLWLASWLGPFEAVKLLPLLSLLFYVVSCYIAAKELWGKHVASLASLLAPFTYTATAGLYGGLFNNWFSLSLALLASAALAKWQKTGKILWSIIYLFLLASSVASHVYMGVVTSFVFTVTLLLQLVRGPKRSRIASLLLIQLVLFTIGVNFADKIIESTGQRLLPSKIVQDLVNAWLRTSAKRPLFSAVWWDDFSFAVFNYAATAALDPTVWLLTTLAAGLVGFNGLGGGLTNCWLTTTASLMLLAPKELIFRVFFDFPYPLTEAFAVAYIASFLERKWGARASKLCVTALILYKFAYTLNFAYGLALGG
ncbi:MAG: hypothetical protein NZ954_03565 [Thermofilaceae archaeon]|nr:hypothetical protein [Thermofilaceae archaeon]MDW8004861.1 hypothetical protein [Thermofilaceae archaeon]